MAFLNMKSTTSIAALAAMCSFVAVTSAEAAPRDHHKKDKTAQQLKGVGALLHGAADVVRAVNGTPEVVVEAQTPVVVSAPAVVQAPVVVQTPVVVAQPVMVDPVLAQIADGAVVANVKHHGGNQTVFYGYGNPYTPAQQAVMYGYGNPHTPKRSSVMYGHGNPHTPKQSSVMYGHGNPHTPKQSSVMYGHGNPPAPSGQNVYYGTGNPSSGKSGVIYYGKKDEGR